VAVSFNNALDKPGENKRVNSMPARKRDRKKRQHLQETADQYGQNNYPKALM
jgi:hypothetical protein